MYISLGISAVTLWAFRSTNVTNIVWREPRAWRPSCWDSWPRWMSEVQSVGPAPRLLPGLLADPGMRGNWTGLCRNCQPCGKPVYHWPTEKPCEKLGGPVWIVLGGATQKTITFACNIRQQQDTYLMIFLMDRVDDQEKSVAWLKTAGHLMDNKSD